MSFEVFAAEVKVSPWFREFTEHTRKDDLRQLARSLETKLMRDLGVSLPVTPNASALPPGSFFYPVEFTLNRNYVSRDDPSYYPTDNPIRRDHIFKVPMVSGSTWKGSLRAAAIELLLERPEEHFAAERLALWKLFGDEKGEPGERDEGSLSAYLDRERPASRETFRGLLSKEHGRDEDIHNKGRLRCFPTFFEKIGLDYLNPRDRTKRAGSVPITMEVVPAGTAGVLHILYCPFDLIGRNEKMHGERQRDWRLLREAISHMMLVSGFGGKKSVGCGTALLDEPLPQEVP